MPSNWLGATQARERTIEAALQCPKCGAANRPRATVVEFDPRAWTGFCAVCAYSWPIDNDPAA